MNDLTTELTDRLAFLKFDDVARDRLKALQPILRQSLGPALDTFYQQVRSNPETRRFFKDEALIQNAKSRQQSHWDTIASGNYDAQYAAAVKRVGETHARIGLDPRWYIGGYALVTEELIKSIVRERNSSYFKRMTSDTDELGAILGVLVKAVILDMDLANSTYLDALDEKRRQAEAEIARTTQEQAHAMKLLSEALALIANGDLQASIDKPIAADFEEIKQNFNETATRLHEALSAVLVSMQVIENGNHELAQASDDLARRTEQQAASLEQTTAALAHINVGVQQTTQGVSHARTVAASASQNAAHTNAIVAKSKVAMDEIKSSTGQIGQITDVIDEIAFQTNLLALNAGVEAARAGESGRGFAVVALEVRSLAQRASESARHIRQLIDHATTSVAEGAELVANTDEALTRFTGQVQEINAIINTIAATASEQANGLAEVSTAVTELDHATQQNAAMVEQATAATQSLAGETAKLAHELAFFKVAGAHQSDRSVLRRRA